MKTIYVVLGIVASVVLLVIGLTVSANNTAIGYDEAIKSAKSGISVQEKRQHDLVSKLVQVVEADSKFESSTQLAIASARSSLKAGNVTNAALTINAVAEQYPDLKASTAYIQLMTELSVSENLKAQFRVAYNDNVQGYNRFVRRFPNPTLLSWVGYEVVKYDYLDFQETTLPSQLFQP